SILNAVNRGKTLDGMINNSTALTAAKNALLNGNGNGSHDNGGLLSRIRSMISQMGITSDDIKNLTISTLLLRMSERATNKEQTSIIENLKAMAQSLGIGEQRAQELL
ncbi:MAG: flotillin family protein, partial [Bacteroidota bacterium]